MNLRDVFGIIRDILAPIPAGPQAQVANGSPVVNPIQDTPSVVVNVPDQSFSSVDKKELGPELKMIYDRDREERNQLISEIKNVIAYIPHYKLSHVRGSKPIHYYEECNGALGMHRLYVCDVVGLHERPLTIEEIETKRKVPCRKCHATVLKQLKKIIPTIPQVAAEKAQTVIEKSAPKPKVRQPVKPIATKRKRHSPMTQYQLKYIANEISKALKRTNNEPNDRKGLVKLTGISQHKIVRVLQWMRRHKLIKTNGHKNILCRYWLP